MSRKLPEALQALLEAADDASREKAWAAFVDEYSRPLLGTTRYLSTDYDGQMDRYGFVLEELRRDDFKRLRGYEAEPRSQFTTWLVVVTRRLCRDWERKRYGRAREGDEDAARERLETRRRLTDLIVEELEPGRHPSDGANPERSLRQSELREALDAQVAGLDPDDRLLLRLRFEDDVPVKRIARVMNLASEFHVYRRLKHVLGGLRSALRAAGIDGPEP